MQGARRLLGGALALAMAAGIAGLAAPAGATTLVRAGLDKLVAGHSTVVVGEVLDVHSYWNEEGTFILTDVRLGSPEFLKGRGNGDVTITLMGGRVGDITTLIIGGAELIPGRSYLLFLDHADLPGAKGVLTVREHSQGVFDLEIAGDGLRAVSQAKHHPLVPDSQGEVEAPGGAKGMPLTTMINSIRDLAGRSQGVRPEVK